MASVVLTPGAAASLDHLHEPMITRVLKILERLESWPEVSGAKPLSGKLAGRFRMRTGDYRVQFFVADGAVVVEKIGHRDRFYD